MLDAANGNLELAQNGVIILDEIDKIADELLESKTGVRDVETKLDNILRPALYRVFKSPADGICEIDSNGSIKN